MLTKDVNKRVSALESMQDPWFKKFEEKKDYDKKLASNVLKNMQKFKKHRTFEKTITSFIINQLVKKDERLELEKQFKDWDSNGDGVLSREEIVNGYRKTYGKVDENEIDNMIKSIDLDGNGVIDYNEFLTCSMNQEKIMRNDNLKLCFDEFDTDHSGKISLDEIGNIFKRGNNDNEEDIEAFKNMIKAADENGDGEISFEEFQEIMNKFFM
jgi:calcium-dependent protein kinase